MGPSIVIVDDHARFRAIARELLEVEGYAVVGEAADGAASLALVAKTDPDVVLLDVALPDMSGFDVAERLSTARSIVVLVSSRDVRDLGRRVVSCGAAGFISKDDLSGRTLRAVLARAA
jgi:DNA-binding NarL/FixJ family response regulator